jgi:hypothetical protein
MLRIFVMRDLRTGIVFPKMMPPGTTSLISIPELEEHERELASDAVGTLSHSLQIAVNLRTKGEKRGEVDAHVSSQLADSPRETSAPVNY